LKPAEHFGTVPWMASPPAYRRPARAPVRARRPARPLSGRGGQLAVVALLGVAVIIVLVLAAFGSSTPSFQSSLPAGATQTSTNGRPAPQIVATLDTLRIQLPIAQDAVSGLGYHGAGEDALPLEPVGRQGNEGVFARIFHRIFGRGGGGITYYKLDGGAGPSTGALDVGAAAGTDVYAPVDGTIVSVDDFVLNGRRYGHRIEIQPAEAPSDVLLVTRLRADPALTAGASVTAGTSKIGTVIDLAPVEEQALARYTHDAGNHVTIEIRQAAGTIG
jgi:hypothetical protein